MKILFCSAIKPVYFNNFTVNNNFYYQNKSIFEQIKIDGLSCLWHIWEENYAIYVVLIPTMLDFVTSIEKIHFYFQIIINNNGYSLHK